MIAHDQRPHERQSPSGGEQECEVGQNTFETGQPLRYETQREPGRQFDRFEYVPEAHYQKALEQSADETREERDLRPDGGRYTETSYAWYDADTQTVLSHTEVTDEFANPFFDTIEDAHRFLEHRAELHGTDQYEGLALKKFQAKKVGEAVEVLTDQTGIEDFLPDGGSIDPEARLYETELQALRDEPDNTERGHPDEITHDDSRAPDGGHERVYFWYDPETNAVVQQMIEPGIWASVFDQEEEAVYFLKQYDGYSVADASRFKLYRADLYLLGEGDDILG